jgi:zinc transport system ATP-binding protein
MTRPDAIRMEDVWFSFNGDPVLEDVNLVVEAGDFLAVLGPNGGGKTTLLKLALGLVAPVRGRVTVFGEEPERVRRRVGYVGQVSRASGVFPTTVEQVALMGRLGHTGPARRYTDEDRRAARRALERVEMWKYRARPMSNLSGGETQRVFIGRALAAEPELLLLDEPGNNLDPRFQTGIFEVLRELNREMTIVLVTHEVGVLSQHVKSVACINRRLHHHREGLLTRDMLEATYQCPVELIGHGVPHRVFGEHE